MKTIRQVLLGSAVAAFLLGTQVMTAHSADTNAASDTNAAAGTKQTTLGFRDSNYLRRATEGNLIGAKISQLAADKGSTPELKKLGETLTKAHNESYQKLTQIAQTKGVAVPTDLNARQKRIYDHLASLSGADFDKSVLRYLVRSEESGVRATEAESTKGTDAALKQFATESLPTMQTDLQQARTLYAGHTTHEPAGAQSGQQQAPTSEK